MSYDDEYVVTENSDGSYNVHKASYTESSEFRKMVDLRAAISSSGRDLEAEHKRELKERQDAAKKVPDSNTIKFRKRWMELSGLNSFKNDVKNVYNNLLPCKLSTSIYCRKNISYDYDNLEANRKKRNIGLIPIVVGIIMCCIAPIMGLGMGLVGLSVFLAGLIVVIIFGVRILPTYLAMHTYKNKSTGHQISAQNILDNCSDADSFKWFIYSEDHDPKYIKYFSTPWTKENPVPLIKGDDSKAKLYAWEKRRRVEDKQYFDCTTNTEWARNNPDVSIYSYCQAITGYTAENITDLFSIYYNHIQNNVVVSKKEALLHLDLYLKYVEYINLLNKKFDKCDISIGDATHCRNMINFTCGDLYAHLQWLKRRLNEDEEFVQMLPNLKYSPYLYELLKDLSNDESLLEKSYEDTSIGIDLQWYISNTFQDILKQNLAVHSEELDSIIPYDDSGIENFDLEAAIRNK